MIPKNYQQWQDCIVNKCNIKLTNDFIKTRLDIYENEKNSESITFIQLYGIEHYRNTISWYKQAQMLLQKIDVS